MSRHHTAQAPRRKGARAWWLLVQCRSPRSVAWATAQVNPRRPNERRLHERLQCCVQRLEYDFTTRTGLLVMNEHDCTDISGCIKVFEGIDLEVTTQASGRRDTLYLRVAA